MVPTSAGRGGMQSHVIALLLTPWLYLNAVHRTAPHCTATPTHPQLDSTQLAPRYVRRQALRCWKAFSTKAKRLQPSTTRVRLRAFGLPRPGCEIAEVLVNRVCFTSRFR